MSWFNRGMLALPPMPGFGTQPGLNVPLLSQVLTHITEHPDQWDQSNWGVQFNGCHTAHCVAGWSVSMSGHDILWSDSVEPCDCAVCATARHRLMAAAGHAPTSVAAASRTTNGEYISTVAKRELGLDDLAASRLFHGANTLDQLWGMAEEFSGGELTRAEKRELVAV